MFIRFDRMYERDRHTHADGHLMTAKAALEKKRQKAIDGGTSNHVAEDPQKPVAKAVRNFCKRVREQLRLENTSKIFV